MISKYLDSEVSFGHYLSRRYLIEDILDFIGDEQDLLSMYLTNGFCVPGSETRDSTVMFMEADSLVRTPRTPKNNRANSDLIGVELPARWKRIADEVCVGHPAMDRHNFDILFTIMNQPLPALMHLQKRISRWRSGGGGTSKASEHTNYTIGERQFIVILNFMDKKEFRKNSDITGHCRAMAYLTAKEFNGTTDSVVLTLFNNSKIKSYDSISFFRMKPENTGKRDYII